MSVTVEKYKAKFHIQEVGRIKSENGTLLFIKSTGGGSREHDVHLNLLNLEKQKLITLTIREIWRWNEKTAAYDNKPVTEIDYSKNYNDVSMTKEREILEELKKKNKE